MKSHDPSISHPRRALCATTLALLIGAGALSAQSGAGAGAGAAGSSGSGGAGSANYGESPSNRTSGSGTTGSSVNSSSTRNQSNASNSSNYGTTRSGSTNSSMSTTGSMNTDADKLSWGDKRFVTKAADHGQSELALAQLASQQASNPEVRSFAQKLVNDHTKVNSELMKLAGNKNVKLDQEDSKDRTYKRLSNRSGSDFDQEFVEQMIDMHEADVKLFEKTAEDAKDQELRSFASRHVGHLREHLQRAQSLRQSIIPTGRDSDASGATQSTTSGSTGSSLDSTAGETPNGAGSTNPSAASSGSSTSGTNDTTSTSSGSSSSSDQR